MNEKNLKKFSTECYEIKLRKKVVNGCHRWFYDNLCFLFRKRDLVTCLFESCCNFRKLREWRIFRTELCLSGRIDADQIRKCNKMTTNTLNIFRGLSGKCKRYKSHCHYGERCTKNKNCSFHYFSLHCLFVNCCKITLQQLTTLTVFYLCVTNCLDYPNDFGDG